MTKPGDVVSYPEMCGNEGVNLQRSMNYRLKRGLSVILMGIRPGAPYADRRVYRFQINISITFISQFLQASDPSYISI